MTDLSTIVKAYDVRGLVPEQWDAAVARALGAAFADLVHEQAQRVVIARDMRASGAELTAAFADGVTRRGLDVVDIALASTDEMYFASGLLDCPGAMFTASHNPAGYNGIKMCFAQARPVGAETGLGQVRSGAEAYLSAGVIEASASAGRIIRRDVLPDYAARLRELVDLSGIRPLKVVIDAGNGMAGLTAPGVLGDAAGLPALPLDIVPLYFELDGTFPNHEANPLDPKNLLDLQAAVVAHKADIGLAFDGDADRCFVVDDHGVPVSPSAIATLVGLREIERARAGGEEHPAVIHNLIASRAVPELLAQAGARTIRSRVGHSFIKRLMAENEAVFGGEHSAHYYFRDFFFADSGMLAAMHTLAVLGGGERPMSQLAEMYEPYVASGELNSEVGDVPAAVARVLAQFRDAERHGPVEVDELDGVTVDHWHESPRWWFNLRASNTEPLLRLNVEAADDDVMVTIRDEVLRLVREEPA